MSSEVPALPVEVKAVLNSVGVRPVLVDLGASGSAPEVWDPIAGECVYVGFDPDSREMDSDRRSSFLESYIVPCAVTVDGSSPVEFYLTRSPFCSSALEPDAASLDAYLFADLFQVESVVSVQARKLDGVLAELGVDRVHWFKADTQGTDLRLFRSLSTAMQAGVLAIDMEPGLIDAYIGEDLFEDIHSDLSKRGFWLSRLDVKGAVRMRQHTNSELGTARGGNLAVAARQAIRQSPAWCEARYLRSVASLADRGSADWALAWVFAMVDDQPGFALDLAREFGRRFDEITITTMMEEGAVARLRELTHVPSYKKVWRGLVPEPVRRAFFLSRRWLSSGGK